METIPYDPEENAYTYKFTYVFPDRTIGGLLEQLYNSPLDASYIEHLTWLYADRENAESLTALQTNLEEIDGKSIGGLLQNLPILLSEVSDLNNIDEEIIYSEIGQEVHPMNFALVLADRMNDWINVNYQHTQDEVVRYAKELLLLSSLFHILPKAVAYSNDNGYVFLSDTLKNYITQNILKSVYEEISYESEILSSIPHDPKFKEPIIDVINPHIDICEEFTIVYLIERIALAARSHKYALLHQLKGEDDKYYQLYTDFSSYIASNEALLLVRYIKQYPALEQYIQDPDINVFLREYNLTKAS